MKKMRYGSYACEVSVVADCYYAVPEIFSLENDVIAYAVERFFSRNEDFCRKCSVQSWQIRIAKGKDRRNKNFCYVLPAILMELPGNWIVVKGYIDDCGIKVKTVQIVKEHPGFKETAGKEKLAS